AYQAESEERFVRCGLRRRDGTDPAGGNEVTMKDHGIGRGRATTPRAGWWPLGRRTTLLLSLVLGAASCPVMTRPAMAAAFGAVDVFASVNNGDVKHYNNAGPLLETLNTGVGGVTAGCAVDATVHLYVANFTAGSVTKFAGFLEPLTPSTFVASVT